VSADPTAAEVGARLLAHLRRMDGMHSADFAEPPSRISGGFETLIFAFRLACAPRPFDGPLILRLFREAEAAPRARFEAAVNGAIAQLGYPAPHVLHWSPDASVLGGAFLILERLPGENLLSRIVDPALFRFPALLAESQLRLHALDPVPILRAIGAAGFPAERLRPDADLARIGERVPALGLAGLAPGVAWLHAQRPPAPAHAVVCHGDFHPRNVLARDGRVTGVVDWTLRHMKLAEAEYDVGATLVLISHAPVHVPWILRGGARRLRRRLVRAYLARYQAHAALCASTLGYYEALRLLECLLEAGEYRLADLGRAPRPTKPTAFESPEVQAGMFARFRELTGVALALPGSASPPGEGGGRS
jgi:aminoglycoside phosphotransferase (APT) family kinase protein